MAQQIIGLAMMAHQQGNLKFIEESILIVIISFELYKSGMDPKTFDVIVPAALLIYPDLGLPKNSSSPRSAVTFQRRP